jgi:hypothetical protein
MTVDVANESSAAETRERALVELVKLDYDLTLRTIVGVLATATGIRVAGFAAWAALLGFGIRDESAALCGAAAVVTALFMYVDAHHARLYMRALRRAIALEALLDKYVDRLGIDSGDDDAVLAAVAALETHRFGIYRTMPRSKFRLRDVFAGRPRPIFAGLYPGVIVTAASCAAVVAL